MTSRLPSDLDPDVRSNTEDPFADDISWVTLWTMGVGLGLVAVLLIGLTVWSLA